MFDSTAALEKTLGRFGKTAERVRDKIPYKTVGGLYDDYSSEIDWWTNGFWPGLLWLAYRETKKHEYAEWAQGVEDRLDTAMNEFYKIHHDAGFMWYLSAVADYKLTGNKQSATRGYKAASVLASRFNPAGSYIQAWNGDEQNGWAIIDCMMNLPLLYWASDYSKSPRFTNVAQAHAATVMKYFIREDGSAKHICVFDPVSGEYLKSLGGQGYDENSAWSRGAAWALYGFTLSAKYTGRQDFINTAKLVANFFISHLPDDNVPFSDFKAPADENIHKDSSAAACAASALLLLSKLIDQNESTVYRSAGEKIVRSLYENYTDWKNDEALIQKGCVAFHMDYDYETSLIYGDFFFLEALLRLEGKEGLF